MRLSLLVLLLLALAPGSSALAQNQDENPVYGVWLTDGGKSKVHVHKCGGGLCSTIIWLKRALDSDGKPQLDELNQNVSLRQRPVVGIKILDGMTQTARYEWEGKVYNPEDGKSYKAYLALIKPDVLRLKGCMPMGWPCRSKFWKKLNEDPPGQEPDPIIASPAPEQRQDAPRQLADNRAAAPEGQPRVTTQSVTGEAPPPPLAAEPPAPRPAETARAPQAEAPQRPRQLTPPRQQAAPPPVPPQQTTRVPDIPPPPPLPELEPQPARPAAPSVAVRPAPVPPSVAPRQRAAAPPPPPPPSAATRPAPPAAAPQGRPLTAPEGRRFAALPPQAPGRPQSDDGARYLVQVAARQNRKEALDVYHDLRRRYPQLLGSAEPIIMKVDLGDLGIWYRVRVGPITGKSAALAFCNRLKFAGSDCFIRRQ